MKKSYVYFFVLMLGLNIIFPVVAAEKCGGAIHFEQNRDSTQIHGIVSGDTICKYTFDARKGQQLMVSFGAHDRPQAVLYSPVEAMLVDNQSFTLPQSGKYELRVGLTRNDARKYKQAQPFTMTFTIRANYRVSAETDIRHNSISDFVGTYKAELPCASCGGVDTQLVLNRDGKYTLNEDYIGRGHFTLHGSWMPYGQAIILQSNASGQDSYLIAKDGDMYFVSEDEAKAANPQVNPNYRLIRQ